jgi:hypothetical protein
MAEDEFTPPALPLRQSYLAWYFSSLGFPTLLLIVGMTVIAAGIIVLLFLRGRGPAALAAMAFALPLPLFAGAICFLGGTIGYFKELAEAQPGQRLSGLLSYGLVAIFQASSCFCPLLALTLTLLMVLGFRSSASKSENSRTRNQ